MGPGSSEIPLPSQRPEREWPWNRSGAHQLVQRKQPAPHSEFDPKSSNDGQYAGAIEQKERRESIPSVLYPIAGRDPRERMRLPHAAGCGDARVGRGLGRHAAETFARRRTRGWCRATNHSAVACTAPPAQKVFTRRAFCDKTRTFPPPACLPWNFLPCNQQQCGCLCDHHLLRRCSQGKSLV